jgi:chorismate mutase
LRTGGVALPPGHGWISGFVPRVERDYLERVLPMIAQQDAPVAELSTVRWCDEACVRALLLRLDFAVRVAELKIKGGGVRLRKPAAAGDAAALRALITYPSVEQAVIARARGCAAEYAAGNRLSAEQSGRLAVAMEAVYRDWLIPLSRDVQVVWLIAQARQPRGG